MLQQVRQDLVCACYCSHTSSVDQSTVDGGLLVGDAQWRIAECIFDWKHLGACPVVASSRSPGCADYGRPVQHCRLLNVLAMWPDNVVTMLTLFDVSDEC